MLEFQHPCGMSIVNIRVCSRIGQDSRGTRCSWSYRNAVGLRNILGYIAGGIGDAVRDIRKWEASGEMNKMSFPKSGHTVPNPNAAPATRVSGVTDDDPDDYAEIDYVSQED